jgi:glycosyltransferase involved in cell wall biosynthesis
LDNSPVPYTAKDLNSRDIRGGENIIIHLSKELARLDNYVEVSNNNSNCLTIDNVKWNNINNANKENIFDYAFTNNDIRLFNKISAKDYIAFSHSVQSIEKFIRKGQLLSFLKYKPKVVLLGKYHNDNRNFLLKIFGSINLHWAVDPLFLETEIDETKVENRAIFTSRKDRNLDMLVNIWKKKIFPRNKYIKLFATPSELIDNNFNIFSRKFEDKTSMVKEMLKSKVLLVPGHKGELFCIAAEEARELCIPIITLGIGSLSERVEHGVTGYIAKNSDEFADFTLNIFNNYNSWKELRNNLLKRRGSKKWQTVASSLLKQL